MMDKINNFIKDFFNSLQTVKLYGLGHPISVKSVEKAYLGLQDIFAVKEELVIGIISEELAFEKEILFDLSKLLRPMILYLKSRGIERLAFSRYLQQEEMLKFIEILATLKEEVKAGAEDLLLQEGIRNISIGKVMGSSGAELKKAAGAVDFVGLYAGALDKVGIPLTQVLNREALDSLSLRMVFNNIFDNFGANSQQLLKLVALKRYDSTTFTHLLNVSVLSVFFASKLGFSKDAVLDIGMSALFHDIGKLYVSRRLISKVDGLSSEEFAQIASHTFLGSRLLLQYVDSLGVMPVVVSFEHHIKYDLSGYPKAPFIKRQNIASALVSICDVYDALSERRSYKSDYPPNMIYNMMMRGRGSAFHPELLDIFFKIMGVWPIGSIVSLSDKRVAVVEAVNEDDIFRPVVRIISPENNRETINLKQESKLSIEHYLNSFKEGKEFLHLI
jgi:HD-GYP domain-containing protein (c-di-GMP phosphodiesterase class II)